MPGRAPQKTVLIIGGGPAGLAAAYRLGDPHFDVHVLEASPYVGGFSRSFSLWGQTVDLGPHRFFTTNELVQDLWAEVTAGRYTLVNRKTRIFYGGRFFDYPLRPANVLTNLSPRALISCLGSYLFAKLKWHDRTRFKGWVVSRFGERLFDIFFRGYTEKLWGVPCDRIDADWAAQRIRKLSLWEAIKAAVLPRKGTHRTLADVFQYPHGGAGAVYEEMAKRIVQQGGRVQRNSPVRRVLVEPTDSGYRATGVELVDGTRLHADYVVSTMPITELVKGIGVTPPEVKDAAASLRFRNTILVYVDVGVDPIFPDNWLYINSDEVRHGRITNFANWCPTLRNGQANSILCLEFWCFDEDPLWSQSDHELGELAKRELHRLFPLPDSLALVRTHVERLRRSYPVYEVGYRLKLAPIREFVDSIENLSAIGRYGSFKYNNQDHSLLMGILTANLIRYELPKGLWHVNTDEEYQESGLAHLPAKPADLRL